MENNKGQWSSNFGFLMAAIGSAVGLGNIWGFPYKMGANGGGAFLLVYVILVVFVGFAVMLGELTIGRKTGKGAVGAYRALNKKLPWVGYMGVGSAFLILGFYSVLGGMVMRYMLGFLVNMFGGAGFAAEGFFGSWIANMPGMVGFYALFMLLNIVIVMGGISGGIEKFSQVAMPALAVMLVTVIVYVACQPGAMEGYKFMFVPDFSVFDSLKSFFDVLKSAAGQMFFSLSLGMGAMITYGSYLSKSEDLNTNTIIIPVADTIVAIMAGMAVMPACSAFGMDYGQGPGLLFNTLQTVFMDGMGGFIGNLMGFLFYTLVFIAAITSSISLLEVNTAYIIDKRLEKGKKVNRKSITVIMRHSHFHSRIAYGAGRTRHKRSGRRPHRQPRHHLRPAHGGRHGGLAGLLRHDRGGHTHALGLPRHEHNHRLGVREQDGKGGGRLLRPCNNPGGRVLQYLL